MSTSDEIIDPTYACIDITDRSTVQLHPVSDLWSAGVEDFIFCTFKHVANIKTVSMLSFNHQQNKATG